MKKKLNALTLDDIKDLKADFAEELCELCRDFEKITGTSINTISLLRELYEEINLDVVVDADIDLLLTV